MGLPFVSTRRLGAAGQRRLSLLLVTACGCFWSAPESTVTRAAQPRQPNVLLIMSDDQRPDSVGVYQSADQRPAETPNLDALARRGIRFTRAVSPNPICTPARAEIMTGCSGFRSGVLDFGGREAPGLAKWAQSFQDAGYRTCYIGKWHNRGRPNDWGYAETIGLYSGGGGRWAREEVDFKGMPITGYRGWVFQSADGSRIYADQGVGLTDDISRRFADSAISFLRGRRTEPFFLHVNFTAPHDPLLMPPGYADRFDPDQIPLPSNYLPVHPFEHGNISGRDEQLLPWPRSPELVKKTLAYYYAVVAHMDEQIGRMLHALEEQGLTDKTLVVFTSDHGIAIGSHGLRGKQNMYEHTIGVPLLIAGPEVVRGKTCHAQVYLRDLFPTMCEMAALDIPDAVEAKIFAPVLRGQSESHHNEIFGYFRDSQRMIRTDRWKLIYYPRLPRYQLFDLENDPAEQDNLAADPARAEQFMELRTRLADWMAASEPPGITAR
jgi:arylsulfatase A-like enzyme